MKCWNLYCITWSMTLLFWYCSILPTTALWRLTANIHKKKTVSSSNHESRGVRSHIRGRRRAEAGGGGRKIGFNTNHYMCSHMRGRGAEADREQNPLRKKWVQHPICRARFETARSIKKWQIRPRPLRVRSASTPRMCEHTRGSGAGMSKSARLRPATAPRMCERSFKVRSHMRGRRRAENWLQHKSLHVFTHARSRSGGGAGAKSAPQEMGPTSLALSYVHTCTGRLRSGGGRILTFPLRYRVYVHTYAERTRADLPFLGDNDGLERAVSKRTRQIGCWTHFLRSGFCSRSASAPRPRMCEHM